MCVRLAEQIAQGADRCHLKCGGPRKGMLFPLYEGPLVESWLAAHCFVCGVDASQSFEIDAAHMSPVEKARRLGICPLHVRVVQPEK